MMNIQNLGLKESLGVKLKGEICAESYLKLLFESDCYLCNITLSQDGFERDCPETKFQTISS